MRVSADQTLAAAQLDAANEVPVLRAGAAQYQALAPRLPEIDKRGVAVERGDQVLHDVLQHLVELERGDHVGDHLQQDGVLLRARLQTRAQLGVLAAQPRQLPLNRGHHRAATLPWDLCQYLWGYSSMPEPGHCQSTAASLASTMPYMLPYKHEENQLVPG